MLVSHTFRSSPEQSAKKVGQSNAVARARCSGCQNDGPNKGRPRAVWDTARVPEGRFKKHPHRRNLRPIKGTPRNGRGRGRHPGGGERSRPKTTGGRERGNASSSIPGGSLASDGNSKMNWRDARAREGGGERQKRGNQPSDTNKGRRGEAAEDARYRADRQSAEVRRARDRAAMQTEEAATRTKRRGRHKGVPHRAGKQAQINAQTI